MIRKTPLNYINYANEFRKSIKLIERK